MKSGFPILLLNILLLFQAPFVEAAVDGWVDLSPHKELFAKANGVQLSYLDWGGQGDVLLFLAGLGDSAHIFDDIAPRFTNHLHVLALSRRGYGKSDRPVSGYDTETLVEDVHQFLDGLKVDRVILVGHSIAGDELTRFAALYPERVAKLVYLDAAYDRSSLTEIIAKSPPEPQPSEADNATLAAYAKWSRKMRPVWSDACEASMRDTFKAAAAGTAISFSTPNRVSLQMLRGAVQFHPDYSKINAPALAIFALDDDAVARWDERMPKADAAARKQAREFQALWRPEQLRQIERFRREVKHGRVVEMRGTVHHCFIQKQAEVVRLMEAFLKEN